MFIGYPFGIKGYTSLDLETRKIFVSENVTFYENVFPFKNSISNPQSQQDQNYDNFTQNLVPYSEKVVPIPVPNDNQVLPLTESQNTYSLEDVPPTSDNDESQFEFVDNSQNPNASDISSNTSPITHYPRRSERIRRAPTHLQDFICEQATFLHPSQELDKLKGHNFPGKHYPLSASISYKKIVNFT